MVEALTRRRSKARCVTSDSPATSRPGASSRDAGARLSVRLVPVPLNCFDARFRSFEQHVLPELNRRGIAVIGMKSLGGDGRGVLKPRL